MSDVLDPQLVLGAYSVGVFPMADSRDAASVYWVEPRRRAVLPLDGFQLSRSLRKTIAADRFQVTVDTAFERVVQLCA
ncbi:MAG: leucyl/phenylalanyl-tRNA--protein transferase, partial [Sphingomonas sp.]